MAPGFTVDLMMSERVVGQLICLVGGVGLILLLIIVVFTRPFWRGTGKAKPQEEDIATDNGEEQTGPDWIHVDATPPPPEEEENDATPLDEEKDATPLDEAKTDPNVPDWAEVGSPPPQSFKDLLNSTPDGMLRCRIPNLPGGCPHNRLNKKGTNQFQARVKCSDCGELIALCPKPKRSAAAA